MVGSSDNGQTWSSVVIPNHYSWLSGVGRLPRTACYLVGDEGKILMSTDGGKTYARLGLPPMPIGKGE